MERLSDVVEELRDVVELKKEVLQECNDVVAALQEWGFFWKYEFIC
jgi:hypothetical protein